MDSSLPEQNYNQVPNGNITPNPYSNTPYGASIDDPNQKPKLGSDEKAVLILVGLCVVLGILFGFLTQKPSSSEEQKTQEMQKEQEKREAETSKYETMNNSELLNLYNETPDNMFADLSGAKYRLYDDGSASSVEDALGKISAKNRNASVSLSSKSDDRYTVIMSYEDNSGEWITEYWVVYKDSVFDVKSETFNADENYFWGNTDNRLKNFLDTYVSIEDTEHKLVFSELNEDSSEYKYTYYYFSSVLLGPDVMEAHHAYTNLYRGKIVINKETRRFSYKKKSILKSVYEQDN